MTGYYYYEYNTEAFAVFKELEIAQDRWLVLYPRNRQRESADYVWLGKKMTYIGHESFHGPFNFEELLQNLQTKPDTDKKVLIIKSLLSLEI